MKIGDVVVEMLDNKCLRWVIIGEEVISSVGQKAFSVIGISQVNYGYTWFHHESFFTLHIDQHYKERKLLEMFYA